MNNLRNVSYPKAILKNLLPSESESHKARIIEITDIIVDTAWDKIAFIILFGPFARGDFTANSDYNFLILTREKKYADRNKAKKLSKRISDMINSNSGKINNNSNKINSANDNNSNGNGDNNSNHDNSNKDNNKTKTKTKTHHFNLTIEPADYANSPTNQKKYFFADIKRDGILLYDSGEFELLRLPGLEINSEERIKNAKINCNHLINKTSNFIKYFQFGITIDDSQGAAFHLHQIAERLFNCIISASNGYEPRIHDLTELNKLCSVNSSQFPTIFPENDPEARRSFDLLQKAYLKSRYDGEYEINSKQLEYLAGRVMILIEIVISHCNQRINEELF